VWRCHAPLAAASLILAPLDLGKNGSMTDDPMHAPCLSGAARYLFSYLHHRGGSVRLDPLLRGLGIDQRLVVDAVIELAERYWITILWHKAPPGTLEDEPRPLADVYRLCTTRFGRKKYRSTWPAD
jgi:GNAT superfamily N-acetyltransferase